MSGYAVFSDGACDLPVNTVRNHNINIIPFKISFDKVTKLTEGVDITIDEFYTQLMNCGSVPKTYTPTISEYVSVFKKSLDQGQDVLCLCLSSKLSKSYANAFSAKKILSYTYKDAKIRVIDTLSASGAQAMLVLDAVKLREKYDIEAAFNKLEDIKKSSLTVFTISSLEQLAKGGRLSASAAVLGKLLNINPILYMEGGALVSKSKAIGRQKALEETKKLMEAEMGGDPKKYDFCILHSRAPDEAATVAKQLESVHGIRQAIAPIELGMTIGMHTGPTVVAIAFVKKICNTSP